VLCCVETTQHSVDAAATPQMRTGVTCPRLACFRSETSTTRTQSKRTRTRSTKCPCSLYVPRRGVWHAARRLTCSIADDGGGWRPHGCSVQWIEYLHHQVCPAAALMVSCYGANVPWCVCVCVCVRRWRLKRVQSAGRRMFETILIASSFAVIGFWVSWLTRSCKQQPHEVQSPQPRRGTQSTASPTRVVSALARTGVVLE